MAAGSVPGAWSMSTEAALSSRVMPDTRSVAHSSAVCGVGVGVGDGVVTASLGVGEAGAGAEHPASTAVPARARAARVVGRLRRTR